MKVPLNFNPLWIFWRAVWVMLDKNSFVWSFRLVVGEQAKRHTIKFQTRQLVSYDFLLFRFQQDLMAVHLAPCRYQRLPTGNRPHRCRCPSHTFCVDLLNFFRHGKKQGSKGGWWGITRGVEGGRYTPLEPAKNLEWCAPFKIWHKYECLPTYKSGSSGCEIQLGLVDWLRWLWRIQTRLPSTIVSWECPVVEDMDLYKRVGQTWICDRIPAFFHKSL